MEFVLLEETQSTHHHTPVSYYYTHPREEIICYDVSKIDAALDTVEKLRSQGLHLVGSVSYEAAYGLPRFATLAPDAQRHTEPFPYLHFLAFSNQHILTRAEGLDRLYAHLPDQKGLDSLIFNKRSKITQQAYLDHIQTIQSHIQEGYTYQVNFTSKVEFEYQGDPIALYLQLRERQQVRYSAMFYLKDRQILSFSPELYFKKTKNHLKVSPMKGTSPRSTNPTQDDAYRDILTNDPKSLAENLMIVDLMRNDLNTIAQPGTVQVPELFEVERYQTLHQMVSTVTCSIDPALSFKKILQGIFPCGSITGAPKYQTMKIIQQLEQERRGVYTGAIGYIQPDNDMCFSVAIRTLCLHNGIGEMGIGSGVVADSVPMSEFAELQLKAKFIEHVGVDFKIFTSILYTKQSGYHDLPLHLRRLQDSAQTFGFPYTQKVILRALSDTEAKLSNAASYKVKVQIDKNGHCHVEYHAYNQLDKRYRVMIEVDVVIQRQNILFQHKTTADSVRGLYDHIQTTRCNGEVDEVIFTNSDGYITEGTKTNLFIVKDGVWLTPYVSCGLLPGIMRGKVIEQNQATESLLTPADIINADEFWICNSIIGLQPAEVIENGSHCSDR